MTTPHKLTGSLLITNVSKLLNSVTKLVTVHRIFQVDLSDVTHIDSAGVAFLVELKNIAQQKKCKLTFINLPAPVNKFCQLYQITL